MLAHRFGYDTNHLDDLACVYESWDGTGFPGRASGEVITVPARVVYVASLAVAARHEAGAGATLFALQHDLLEPRSPRPKTGSSPVVASSAAAKTEVNSPPGTRRK